MENTEEKISCNIVDEELYKKIVNLTVNKISNSLSKSLGYYGSSTVIEDKVNGHIISKDGYTILQYMKFENPVASLVYDLIKKISYNLVQTVGDGSTSSIIIAAKMFNIITYEMNNKLKNYSSKEIFDEIKNLENILTEYIEKYSTKITEKNFEMLKYIAEVSNNNDNKVGKNIFDIYNAIRKDGFIYLENSKGREDTYEFLNGLEFASGMISEDFSNNKNKPEFKVKDPFILMSNNRLDSTDLNLMVESIGELLARQTKPVVIIAPGFTTEFISCWIINKKQEPNLQICLVDYNYTTKNQQEIFKDIATYTNSVIYDKNVYADDKFKSNFFSFLGNCDEITITDRTTKIIGRKCTDEELQERLDFIDEDIKTFKDMNDDTYERRIFELETRKANLQAKIVKYYVGGDTEIEKNNRRYLIEDSIFACRAALESGYVSGGNLVIPKIILNEYIPIKSELSGTLLSIIYNSFIESYKCVLMNKFNDGNKVNNMIEQCVNPELDPEEKNNTYIYNLKTDKFEKDSETTIINSAKTEIEIMKAVFSIIGLLSLSNQFIGRSF